jgi:hypothetical protein
MGGGGFAYDYFISRRGTAAALAREAADVMDSAGYKVRVLDYDFTASGQFVRDIDDALKQSRHLLILHTADHHDSFWSQQEFHNVLAAVADSDGQRRIGVLRCDSAMPGGLLHSATYGDLGRFERCVDALSEGSGRLPAGSRREASQHSFQRGQCGVLPAIPGTGWRRVAALPSGA